MQPSSRPRLRDLCGKVAPFERLNVVDAGDVDADDLDRAVLRGGMARGFRTGRRKG
jgi:hypothetical protein